MRDSRFMMNSLWFSLQYWKMTPIFNQEWRTQPKEESLPFEFNHFKLYKAKDCINRLTKVVDNYHFEKKEINIRPCSKYPDCHYGGKISFR